MDEAPKSSPPSTSGAQTQADLSAASTSLLDQILPLIEVSGLATAAVLHPIQFLTTYTPNLRLFNTMFGGLRFAPAADIRSLSGKVILVTGGRS